MTRAEAYLDLFWLFCGAAPPVEIPPGLERLGDLSDEDYFALQTFAANSKCAWLTGIGVLEAMDSLVDEAIANSQASFDEAAPSLYGVVHILRHGKTLCGAKLSQGQKWVRATETGATCKSCLLLPVHT